MIKKRKISIPGQLSILLLLFVFSPVTAQKLSLAYNNQSLTTALNTLSARYNLKIAFDTQLADKTIVSATFSKASVDEALSAITRGTGLKVQRMGDVYMIIPENGPKAEQRAELNPGKPMTDKPKMYICGVVKDKISGESLPFASIFLSGNHLGTSTGTDGYFRIEMPASDTAYIVVNYLGYLPHACKVIPQPKPVLQTIFLDPRIESLQAIIVKEKVEVFDNTGTNMERIKFNPSRMANIPSLTELDITAPLQMLPGINATNENAGGFSIHDASPDKTLMVYDGFTLYHMNHFFGAFSSINNKSVKDIQVYKNGFDAHYGGSTSGIIEITGKSGNMQKTVIDVGADMLAADAKVEIPIVKNKCSFLFAGRRSFTDVLRTPLYNQMFTNARYDFNSYYRKPPVAFSSGSEDPDYYYNDANGKLTFLSSENSVFSLSAFSSLDNLDFTQMSVYPKIKENTKWGTQGVSMRWAGKLAQGWQSEFVVGSSKTKFNYDYGDSILKERRKIKGVVDNFVSKLSNIDSHLDNTSINWFNSFELSKDQKIEAGLSLQAFTSLYDYHAALLYNELNIQDTLRNYYRKSRLNAFWFQYQLSGEDWELKPGIRISRYNIISRVYPEFRMSALYKATPLITFKAKVGNYFQFINKVNIEKQGDFRSVWIISDGERYPVVSSFLADGGFNYAITSTINLDVEFYYKGTENLISSIEEYRVKNDDVKIANASWYYNTKVKGLDVLLKQTYGKYQLWTAYTLAKSLSEEKKNSNAIEYPSDNDQLHELKMLHMLKLGNWVFSLSGIYGSGVVWDEYKLNDNLRLSSDYQKNGSRVPAYFRVDAGINYSVHAGGMEWKFGSNFFNIFNHTNIIQRFDKLSATPGQDIADGISPVQENSIYGLGSSYNLFINLVF